MLTRLLYALEAVTIAAGVVATGALLVPTCRNDAAPDDAAPAVAARSACDGGSGLLPSLRAWLDGAELPAEPTTPEPPVDAALRARGAALFTEHCATCHGERGDGTGPTADQLAHPPANFTAGIYELRTTEHEALPADADLFRTMSRGVHGTAMPPWFALPERDRWALVAHLKTLSKDFSDDEAPPPVDIAHPPATTPERIARGRDLYQTAGCASCHGASGRGDGPAANALSYKSGRPARPRDLRIGSFHRGTRLPDIYLTIATGLDGTPMASFAKVMPADDLWSVAMYVASIVPPVTTLADGMRCPHIPEEIRCVDLPGGVTCPDPIANPDELVGARMLLRSLPQ
jgi:mono/diheme cytochrome c family protein